jgi:hypothetical protein
VHALRIRIGATWYQLRQMPAPAGFRTVWTLRKLDPETPAVTYSVAQAKGEDPRCTCPDHEINGAICKHVMALAAAGLIKQPKAARPKPQKAPSARALKAHAKNARAAIAEAKALDPAARRHLAAMGPEPAPIRGTDRRAALVGMPRAEELEIDLAQRAPALPEGWQLGGSPISAPPAKTLPPVPEGSFAAGFRQAVATHLAVKRGDLIECAACRYPFDPKTEGSASRALCGPCLAEEKGGRS